MNIIKSHGTLDFSSDLGFSNIFSILFFARLKPYFMNTPFILFILGYSPMNFSNELIVIGVFIVDYILFRALNVSGGAHPEL